MKNKCINGEDCIACLREQFSLVQNLMRPFQQLVDLIVMRRWNIKMTNTGQTALQHTIQNHSHDAINGTRISSVSTDDRIRHRKRNIIKYVSLCSINL